MPLASRIVLSTSSYAPVFALLGLVSWHGHRSLALGFLSLAVFLAALLAGLMLINESSKDADLLLAPGTRFRVTQVEAEDRLLNISLEIVG
jgi:hypothetical protein